MGTVNAAAGRTTSGVDIRLERAGTVSGRIFSDAGDGIPGVEVELIRRQYVPGGARPIAIGFAQTESLGAFRIRDVAPGEYYVRAYVSPSIHPTRAEKSVAYTGTFFPAATSVDAAQPVVVASGQDVVGIDFSLATTRLRSVSGRLVDSDGQSLATATVHLLPLGNGPVEMPEARAAADGRFRIEGVTPGEYMLSVFDSARTRNWSSLTQQISVVDDVTGLVLAAGPTAVIEGRVVRDGVREDGESPLPIDVSTLSIALEQHVGSTSPMKFSGAGLSKIAADGSFRLRTGTGPMYLQVGTLRAPWSIKRESLDGADVTDALFDLRGGTHRLEIVLTDRVSRLSGTVTDRSARAVINALAQVRHGNGQRSANPRRSAHEARKSPLHSAFHSR